ncbi:MAG: PVC-type heme-binding CxxCH protein, partial [Limisphaerales bacterium]
MKFIKSFCQIVFLFLAIPAPAVDTIANAPISNEAELAIKKFKVAANLHVSLFAAEPMLENPVCFSIDEQGRFFIVETFRLHDGVSDIRGHMDWLDDELASKTTADHLLKLKKYLGKEFEKLTEKSERVQLVEDTDGDGKADKSTVFAEGFNGAGAGLAEGILARRGDIYFTCIPDLYLLRDKNGDGKADEKKSLQTGYGIRTAFLGHDLHGLRFGPDGKLYFSCGDRGFSIEQNGKTIASPETGAVLRCNPDGPGLEIFATGLRNPQELAFDQYGNLFTGDNNSDAGDEARWVYLVEGGDSGWRIGWQFINSPTPRGPWNSEKMWEPKSAREVGYILPPIANLASGPAGVTYNPGVSVLPKQFDEHFFLCDFRGSENSLIHSFAVKPKGASFEIVDRQDFLSGVLAIDIEFGPDGCVYIADWVTGWVKTGKGRLYKISNSDLAGSELVLETKKLINQGMGKRSADDLAKLLSHPDQRVRQEAQFALAEKGASAMEIFKNIAQKNTNQLARIHAIWGLGQISSTVKVQSSKPENAALEILISLLADADFEVAAQAAKVLGDGHYANASEGLLKLLQDVKNPRGQFYAALALGKIGNKKSFQPVLEMLRGNNDQDAYLRHAGVMALVWLNDTNAIIAAGQDNSPAVRLASVVAMRHLQLPQIAMFLNDKQQNIVTEAARAINDLPIVEALPQLAKLIEQTNYSEPLFRRVLNANFRLGAPENAKAMAKFSSEKNAPESLRAEALQLLGDWQKPSGRDGVTGLWRPLRERDAKIAAESVRPILNEILTNAPASVKLAAVNVAGKFSIKEVSPILFDLVSNGKADVKVR